LFALWLSVRIGLSDFDIRASDFMAKPCLDLNSAGNTNPQGIAAPAARGLAPLSIRDGGSQQNGHSCFFVDDDGIPPSS
jgi:hypothetical protein